MKPGPKQDEGHYAQRRRHYMKITGRSYRRPRVMLTASFLDQLDACKDDASRRILLGVSK